MKQALLLLIAFTYVVASTDVAAQITFFTDRTTWLDATDGPYTSESFEDLSQVAPGAIVGCTVSPINSGTSDACAFPGEIEAGLEFADRPGPDPAGLIACGAGCAGTALPSIAFCHNTFVDSLRIDLTNGDATTFGADIGALFGNTDNGTVGVYDAAGNELGEANYAIVSDDMSNFFGVTSVSTPIAYLMLEVADVAGNNVACVDNISFSNEVIVALEPGVPVEFVEDYVLDPAYPNPFNPQASVRFAVRESGPVTMTLINALGQQVQTVYDGTAVGGQVVTATIDGSLLPSGVYMIRLQGESFVGTQSITLLK